MSEGGGRGLVLQRDNFPLAWREGSTGVPEGGSRMLILQRDNFPLAWLEGSTGVSDEGSQVLVQQQDNRQLAWREGSTGVSEEGSRMLELQRDNFPLAWLEGSTGVSDEGSQVLVLFFFFFSTREHYKEWETLETGTKYEARRRETKNPRVEGSNQRPKQCGQPNKSPEGAGLRRPLPQTPPPHCKRGVWVAKKKELKRPPPNPTQLTQKRLTRSPTLRKPKEGK